MKGHKKERVLYFLILIVLAVGIVAISTVAFLFWSENKELASRPELAPVIYYSTPKNIFFSHDESWEGYGENGFLVAKERLVDEKENFIEVDLKDMKINAYENGKVVNTFPAKSKGKEGSWWETTTGLYSVGVKRVNHFSSISQVWMPYGIQFYGNFFIHGWPYDSFGNLLQPGSSGGCIRMNTDDAKKLFEFAETGMPVLVFDEKDTRLALPAIFAVEEELSPPILFAESVLVVDVDTGEIILSKNENDLIPAGPVVKMVNALTASEIIYLERSINAQPFMIAGIKEGIISPWGSYRAFDLLYPILMQSSDEAASVVSYFLGTDNFLKQMNNKVKALRMEQTSFVDPVKNNPRNLTSLLDVAVLIKYIKDKRSFLFGISKGAYYPDKGGVFVGIDNKNPFFERSELLGVISNLNEEGNEFIVAVWEMEIDGIKRNIMTAVANSKDAKDDVEKTLRWLEYNFKAEF